MKINARIEINDALGPDLLDESLGIQRLEDHIVCRDSDGTPHTVSEFIWPWTAYMPDKSKFSLHFYYWNEKGGQFIFDRMYVSPEREARIRELQFLMTRQIYFGEENSPRTLDGKLRVIHHLARFAESRSSTIQNVLMEKSLFDKFGAGLPDGQLNLWIGWIKFLQRLDPETQLGFVMSNAVPSKDLLRRRNEWINSRLQHSPLPTRIYSYLINNLSDELADIEAHTAQLLAALRDILAEYKRSKPTDLPRTISVGPKIIEKYGIGEFLTKRGYSLRIPLRTLSAAINNIFLICRLQIHVFSGMRSNEARTLPYHCMITTRGQHGGRHSLIEGVTTKFNKGRFHRTKWVTTDRDGFRAIRLAQQFADVIYEAIGVTPSSIEANKDDFPLFPSTDLLPWGATRYMPEVPILRARKRLHKSSEELQLSLLPIIENGDIVELEEIDPFRVWREEPKFAIGQLWPLTTHQLRRSLAIYANASGLVRLSSLRRQLQQITVEMGLYYGRGSTFCKNFITTNPDGYKNHIAQEWQDGEEEAMLLAFTCEVLNSKELMFGGAGNFYQRQKEKGNVMTREDAAKQMKAGLLSYQPGPLGGCLKPGGCDKKKGLALVDISCATEGCKNLIGKHSKIIRVIELKRAAMKHITQDSIEAKIEIEELEALEMIELKWRPQTTSL